MSLPTRNNSFVFHLPTTFVGVESEIKYKRLLEKNHMYFDSIIDYINSNILSVEYGGINFDTPTQTIWKGKQIYHKPSININDIFERSGTITFKDVDSNILYLILTSEFIKNKLDVENLYADSLVIQAMDDYKDVIYTVKLSEIIFYSLTGVKFNNNPQIEQNTFTMNFKYNYIEIDFNLDESKVLELDILPKIIQKI